MLGPARRNEKLVKERSWAWALTGDESAQQPSGAVEPLGAREWAQAKESPKVQGCRLSVSFAYEHLPLDAQVLTDGCTRLRSSLWSVPLATGIRDEKVLEAGRTGRKRPGGMVRDCVAAVSKAL